MKKYEPKKLVAVSRYRNYFPMLPLGLQNEIYDRMQVLIDEEKEYCDKENYKHNSISSSIPLLTHFFWRKFLWIS